MAPSRLEYAHAFDQAAGWLDRGRGPLVAVVSTPEFVDLVLARAVAERGGGVTLVCDGERTREHAQRRLERAGLAGACNTLRGAASRVLPAEGLPGDPAAAGGPFSAVLWASPQPATWPDRMVAILRLLEPDGALCILAATRMGRLLRTMRENWQAGEPAVPSTTLKAKLAAAGWRVTHSLALGGLASVGWAAAGRVAARAGRPDWADRAERAHHRALVGGRGASYELLLARREARR
jgi:hypothetical protein